MIVLLARRARRRATADGGRVGRLLEAPRLRAAERRCFARAARSGPGEGRLSLSRTAGFRQGWGKQMYPLSFGVFGLTALGCLGFYALTKW